MAERITPSMAMAISSSSSVNPPALKGWLLLRFTSVRPVINSCPYLCPYPYLGLHKARVVPLQEDRKGQTLPRYRGLGPDRDQDLATVPDPQRSRPSVQYPSRIAVRL